VRRAGNDANFVNAAIGEDSVAIISGPMPKEAAVKRVGRPDQSAIFECERGLLKVILDDQVRERPFAKGLFEPRCVNLLETAFCKRDGWGRLHSKKSA
jgi:hypothetical protein